MTTDPESGVKLRAFAIVCVIVFGVTVTGGYATMAIMTDGETVEMSFDLAGNVGNTAGNVGNTAGNVGNTAGNAAGNAGNTAASMTDPALDPGEEPSPEDRPAVALQPSNDVLAASAKHGTTN